MDTSRLIKTADRSVFSIMKDFVYPAEDPPKTTDPVHTLVKIACNVAARSESAPNSDERKPCQWRPRATVGGMTANPRSSEAVAFLASADSIAPPTLSSCAGWTLHDVVAHLAGICGEVTRHLSPYIDGAPVPATRSFEEREAPYRELDHARLLTCLDREESVMQAHIADILNGDPSAEIPWTGRQMQVAKFVPHLRNEFAIHRWDFVGDDQLGIDLLEQRELTDHSVGVLGEILLRRGRTHDPRPNDNFHVRLRTPEDDIAVVVRDGNANLQREDAQTDGPCIELDPAARALFIWGRLPDDRTRIRSRLLHDDLFRLQSLLSGY